MNEPNPVNRPSAWHLEPDGTRAAEPGDWAAARPESPIWVHKASMDEDVAVWLRDEVRVPQHMLDAMLTEVSRPRWEREGDHALLILRGVNLTANADPEDMITLRIWMGPNGAVSLCRRPLRALAEVQRRCETGHGPRSLGDWLLEIIDGLTERTGPVIDEMSEALDEIELNDSEELTTEVLAPVNLMRNRVVILKRFIAPQLTALTRLLSSPPDWIDARELTRLRNAIDAVTRYVEELDTLRERAAIVRDAVIQQLNERMNRTMYLLTIVAALFLPLGFLTGLLGINVGGMPGVDNGTAFAWVCAGLVVLTGVEIWAIRRFRLL